MPRSWLATDGRRSHDRAALAGRLVTTAGILDQGVLEVLLDGTIGYVGPASGWSGPAPEAVDTVAPGYVDIHCHGGGSHTVTSGDPAEVAAVAAHHLSRGTTTMLASLVSASTPELVAAITAIASVAATGSPVVGCHVEGPFLDPAHRGAHDPVHLRLPESDELATWLAAGVDDAGRPTVRMVTLAPELPGAAAAAELLERSGVVVGLGHTGADARGFGEALRSLRRPLVTHLFNGMEPLHHRRPGPVAASLDALARGATHVELIADGVHLADETVHLVFAVDPGGHVVLVSDAMVAAGMPDGEFELGSVRCGSRRAGRGRSPSRRRSREAPRMPPTLFAAAWCGPASIPSPRWPQPPQHPRPCSAWTTAAAWPPVCAPTSWYSTATGGSVA